MVSEDDGKAFDGAEEKRPEAVFFVLRVWSEGVPQPAYRIGAGLGAVSIPDVTP